MNIQEIVTVVTPLEAGKDKINLKKYAELNTYSENDMYVESIVQNIDDKY